jgi:hypothetical protein
VVGAAVLLVFDRKNPPPPAGLATTAVNFAVVPGDVLFANEPRNPGPELSCAGGQLTAAAPFVLAPLEAGSYQIVAFYDLEGEFRPTFKIRNLPRRGDVGGGYIDAVDALAHAGDPNYQPIYLPVDIGENGVMPAEGVLRDNVPVTVGAVLPLARPYFYPAGADAPQNGSHEAPVLTMTQDHHIKAPPTLRTEDYVNAYQASFPQLRLNHGVPARELPAALEAPFRFQLGPGSGLFVWNSGRKIPEGEIDQLWPLVVLNRVSDADRRRLTPQGSPTEPIIVLQGLTIAGDSLAQTFLAPPSGRPELMQDHLTVLLRPAVICFDAQKIEQGGVLVTPHLTGEPPDPPKREVPLFDFAQVRANLGKQVREAKRGCLPKGRYGINVVYPTGQAWTVPNEAGSCGGTEGETDYANLGCTAKPRPVLYSQGTRAVVDIVDAADPSVCQSFPVPPECLPR